MREHKYQRITSAESLHVNGNENWVIRVTYENGAIKYYRTSTLYNISLIDFFSDHSLIKEIKIY